MLESSGSSNPSSTADKRRQLELSSKSNKSPSWESVYQVHSTLEIA